MVSLPLYYIYIYIIRHTAWRVYISVYTQHEMYIVCKARAQRKCFTLYVNEWIRVYIHVCTRVLARGYKQVCTKVRVVYELYTTDYTLYFMFILQWDSATLLQWLKYTVVLFLCRPFIIQIVRKIVYSYSIRRCRRTNEFLNHTIQCRKTHQINPVIANQTYCNSNSAN